MNVCLGGNVLVVNEQRMSEYIHMKECSEILAYPLPSRRVNMPNVSRGTFHNLKRYEQASIKEYPSTSITQTFYISRHLLQLLRFPQAPHTTSSLFNPPVQLLILLTFLIISYNFFALSYHSNFLILIHTFRLKPRIDKGKLYSPPLIS